MIYDNVVELMIKKNMTIFELERKAGLANGTVRKWNGSTNSPKIESVMAVAKVLGVTANRLLRP